MSCSADTRLAPLVGLCRPIRSPKNLILHLDARRCVDPVEGIVYGALGEPVGAICADGYVRLGQNTRGYLYAHRLIYEACKGPIPAGYCIDHVNGRRDDNRIVNLEAVTPAENAARAFERGSILIGKQRSDAKLTAALVREIRQTIGQVSTGEWACRLGVDRTTVRDARRGTTWRHVPCRGRLPAKPRWRRPK